MFIKLLFIYFLIAITLKAFHCLQDHPRRTSVNLCIDVLGLIELVVLAALLGLYASGTWTF